MNPLHSSLDSDFEEYKQKALHRIAFNITLYMVVVFGILTVSFIGQNYEALMGYASALILSLISFVYIQVNGSPQLIFLLYALVGSVITQITSFNGTSATATHYSDFLWLIACTLLAYISGYKRIALILLLLNTIAVGFYFCFVHNNHISNAVPLSTFQLMATYLEIVGIIGLLTFLTYQFLRLQKYSEEVIRKSNADLRQQKSLIEERNEENVVLLKEIHHRVKNNLQIIVSLLRLHKDELIQDESKAQFQEAINRIMVMSTIHQKLYQQQDLKNIELSTYLSDLVNELKNLYVHTSEITVNIDCNVEKVNLKSMIPIGLLINELISNSLKYAFTNTKKGEINLLIDEQEDNKLIIHYFDNGTWVENKGISGFGQELIEIFTQQLNGTSTFETSSSGTSYHFNLQRLL